MKNTMLSCRKYKVCKTSTHQVRFRLDHSLRFDHGPQLTAIVHFQSTRNSNGVLCPGLSPSGSSVRDDQRFRTWREHVLFTALEPRIAEHLFELLKRVSVAGICGSEHHHAERGGRRR
jgi:hypothetical protein